MMGFVDVYKGFMVASWVVEGPRVCLAVAI